MLVFVCRPVLANIANCRQMSFSGSGSLMQPSMRCLQQCLGLAAGSMRPRFRDQVVCEVVCSRCTPPYLRESRKWQANVILLELVAGNGVVSIRGRAQDIHKQWDTFLKFPPISSTAITHAHRVDPIYQIYCRENMVRDLLHIRPSSIHERDGDSCCAAYLAT